MAAITGRQLRPLGSDRTIAGLDHSTARPRCSVPALPAQHLVVITVLMAATPFELTLARDFRSRRLRASLSRLSLDPVTSVARRHRVGTGADTVGVG